MFSIGPHSTEKPYILAPMAGISQMPFRVLALQCGAGFAPTELISAKGLFFANLRTKLYLTHDKAQEKPFWVQLFGGDEESMAQAAVLAAEQGAHILDINMGCPVKKVTKTGAGSALLCDPQRASSLVRAMKNATGHEIPITVKIRSGWDEHNINCVDMAKILEDAGVAAISLHPRTRAQGYAGKANWQHIARVKEAVRIPVIGNGDVLTAGDAERMQKETRCDAVMIGRAALGNPWIFTHMLKKKEAILPGSERLGLIRQHFLTHVEFHRILSEEMGPRKGLSTEYELYAVRSFRSHLAWYGKGLYGASHFRQRAMQTESVNETLELIESFFHRAEASALSTEPALEDIDYRQAFG